MENIVLENAEHRYTVTAAPHIRSHVTSLLLMRNVVIALLPVLVASVVIFGFRALLVTAVTVAACVLSEVIWCALRKEPHTYQDLTAVITGLLLAFNLPVNIPLYVPVIGAIVAIIVVKKLFGGLGRNFANPAIVARITLAVSFPALMTAYSFPKPVAACDALTAATPLVAAGTGVQLPMIDLFLGTHGGVLGETCVPAILLGLMWLLATHTIEITIPAVFMGTVAFLSLISGRNPLYDLLSGGLMLGAVFMATDYVTSPYTRKGRVVFAAGCGIITCLIRFWGNMNEGVSYSILIMNLLVPLINEKCRKVPLGGTKTGGAQKAK